MQSRLSLNILTRIVALAVALCLSGLDAARAEAAAGPSTRALFRGRILDSSGAPLPSARVETSREGPDPSARGSAVADGEGSFVLELVAGAHIVRISMDRFADATERIVVTADSPLSRDFVLRPSGVREAITVTAPNGYVAPVVRSATKTETPLQDLPQSVTVITRQLMQDQLMTGIGDVVRYVPGITLHQGENNRDQIIVRGNSSSADFFVDGVRDDVPYYRDLYNLDRVEALKGPNAMIFGRGGAGGVVNRVTKEAGFLSLREASVQGGSFDDKRVTADVGQPLGDGVALRVNGLYESSGSFRDGVDLKRFGVAPSLTFEPGDSTRVTVGYEHFRDERVADRGISSFQGRPAEVDIATFYGNPADSHVRAVVDLASVAIEHRIGGLTIRNRTLFGDYDRFYQNYVPGAVTADRSRVALSAYNNATQRQNLFNQTDLTYVLRTGAVKHTLLAGAELGRQVTDNFRKTGFFEDSTTSISAPYASPTIDTPVTFRQNATDADNRLRTNVSAFFVQDQLELSGYLQVVAGVRFDRFDLSYHNNRNGDDLSRVDNLVSPRAGVVYKPIPALSLYGSTSVSYLPSSGDQFSSLTTITRQLEPEEFRNYEVGAKWSAASSLSVTMAVYRLDRTNTRSTDPNDPTRIVQTGSQRTNGYELGVNGQILRSWSVAGGYAYQDATVTSATAAAPVGAHVGQVPYHTFSLWNSVQVHEKVGAALGLIYRSAMFATIDDTVTLPGYTRVDAAVYASLTENLRLQVNVENVLDRRYYANADSNTNITPGSPRATRLGITARF